MTPTFDKRILFMGLVILAVLVFRPMERLRFDPTITGSIGHAVGAEVDRFDR